MQALYTAIATAVGGRDGSIKSSDGCWTTDSPTPRI
jgi:organic hydroperoxide reductase OsmC/OhrA